MAGRIQRITIALSPDLGDLVRAAVLSGEFSSASEVIRDALRQWKHFRPRPYTSPLVPQVEALRDAIAPVCRRLGVRELWAFGNSLRARHRSSLPLEFAVDFGEPTGAAGRQPGQWALLRVELECLSPDLQGLRLVDLRQEPDQSVIQDVIASRQRLYTDPI